MSEEFQELLDTMISRIKSLERQVARLHRRKVKKISAVITPFPVSNCIVDKDISGAILKYLFCTSGRITKGMIRISKLKGNATVEIIIANNIGERSKSYIMNKQEIILQPDFDIQVGDRLTIKVFPNAEEDKITEAWASFLWVPNVNESEVKHFLIDELLSNTEAIEK